MSFKYTDKELEDNFYKITKDNNFTLVPKGFNSISDISVKAYGNHYNLAWYKIVIMFNKDKILWDYINKEYINGNYKSLRDMTHNHPYITHDFIYRIDKEIFKNNINIKTTRYSDNEYRSNFINIRNKISHIPLYQEFEEYSQIPVESYAYRFNLKGKVYDKIVKMCVSEDEYEIYKQNRLIHKTKVGKQTGALSATYTLEELEQDFKRIFDYYKIKYDTYPSRRLFNKISNHDDRTYRKRLSMSWTDICKQYGYVINSRYKEEKIVLGMIAEILSTEYVPQKTWNWLIGVGGKNMYCDGYFEKYNLVVEFDGSQHRIPIKAYGGMEKLKRTQENDILKDKLFNEHNINIIRIDSREKWYDMDYLKQKLINSGIQ